MTARTTLPSASMSVRILHVATRHRVGGAERNLLYTVSRQVARGFEVHVAVGTEDLEANFRPSIRIHPIGSLVREVSPTCDRRATRDLRTLMRTHRFDVVHTHQSKAGAVGRVAARGIVPIVLHTVHMASFGPAYGRARSAVFLSLERRLARFTEKMVFVGSDLQRRYIAAGVVSSNRSVIIRSPIANLESLLRLRDNKGDHGRRARATLGIPPERKVILMVGALDRRKRHALALTALAPLMLEGETDVLIAGQGPELPALKTLCRRIGVADRVKFAGFVGDVTPLYAVADLFVHVSTLEGVPQSVVQATTAGVPVVATEADGVREATSGPPHATILPADGRGLLETARGALTTSHFVPAPAGLVKDWLPWRVDSHLRELHDWMEDRVDRRPSARSLDPYVATPSPPPWTAQESAVR